MTIGIFIFANAQSYGMLLLSQLVIAVGACSGFVGAGYIGGQWFGVTKFSFMFGLVQFAASFFSAFNQNLLSLALTTFSWRGLFNFIGFLGGRPIHPWNHFHQKSNADRASRREFH